MRVLVAAVVALLLASPVAAGSPVARLEVKRSLRAALEQDILRELNRVRRQHGARALGVSPALRAAAVAHSRAMVKLGFIGHDSADGTSFAERIRRYYGDRGWRSWAVGETLLVASPGIGAREVVRAWLDSPPHRAVVLGPHWREVGVGVALAPSGPGAFDEVPTVVVTADYGVRR